MLGMIDKLSDNIIHDSNLYLKSMEVFISYFYLIRNKVKLMTSTYFYHKI